MFSCSPKCQRGNPALVMQVTYFVRDLGNLGLEETKKMTFVIIRCVLQLFSSQPNT